MTDPSIKCSCGVLATTIVAGIGMCANCLNTHYEAYRGAMYAPRRATDDARRRSARCHKRPAYQLEDGDGSFSNVVRAMEDTL